MKRNFDSLSHYSAGDKAEYAKLRKDREMFESMAKRLEAENSIYKTETEGQKETIKTLESRVKDLEKTVETKTREVERLTAELARTKKQHEDKISSINKSNAGLFEQTGKLKSEIQHLKKENVTKQITIDELQTKI